MEEGSRTVLLIAFYNRKALGVRYLERALTQAGYAVRTVFFKDFNSQRPQPVREEELALLCAQVEEARPFLVALSVMSSMYLETVFRVLSSLRARFPALPLVCGGAFASLFPEKLLTAGADYVLRLDGERSLRALADALYAGAEPEDVPSLCRLREGELVANPISGLAADLDAYGLPAVVCRDACLIENGRLYPGDPQLDTHSYEIVASRGCPFRCSYCSNQALARLLPKGLPRVRFRSVESVMAELHEAKARLRRLVFVHFYDEIFPTAPAWIDEFCRRYRGEIGLPFTMWSHPQCLEADTLRRLREAGLVEVIMGIQSGSARVRREVFQRGETEGQILRAVQAIREAGVPWSSFDFMLRHPFETPEDLRATYELVKRFPAPYELQLHGLNFLPGTDIVALALERGLYTPEEMEAVLYAPMQRQFDSYWQREQGPESELWYRMIYCRQFPSLCRRLERIEADPAAHAAELARLYAHAQKQARLRYLRKKGRVVLRRYAGV